MLPRLFTPEEVSKLTGGHLTVNVITELIRSKKIPYIKATQGKTAKRLLTAQHVQAIVNVLTVSPEETQESHTRFDVVPEIDSWEPGVVEESGVADVEDYLAGIQPRKPEGKDNHDKHCNQ